VLAEGDDQQDPIADAARAILDGHIVLSRELADAGHYPAIDVEASVSRVMIRASMAAIAESVRLADSISQLQQAVPETAVARSNNP
jgi:flagellum-specific ATP synthase